MSTDQEGTIFKEETTVPNTETPDLGVKTPQPQPDLNSVFKDQLSSITDENGEQKYNDVMTALSALKHTQEYVKTLETENAGFREEDTKAATMDEVLAQLKTTQDKQSGPTSSPELDVDKLRNVTLETLMEYEAQKVSIANQQKVIEALTGKFKSGEKAEEAFIAKARDLGISVKTMNELSASSPKAVLEYFQMSSSESTSSFVEGSVNTDALASQTSESPAKKNIMYGASTEDIVSAWRSAGQPSQ